MLEIVKNRERAAYSFANINLLGTCNANCYFCLGKDLKKELKNKNQLSVHFSEWKNFPMFLMNCRQNNIKKLYITGQTTDGLQYDYLDELVTYLQSNGFIIGVRTNGKLALQKMPTIQKMRGGIGYSIHSLNPTVNKKIMGWNFIPDWDKIIPQSGNKVRISIVVNKYNINEIESIVKYISKFNNVRYIQLRRISTDTRVSYLQEDIDLYEDFFNKFKKEHDQIGEFYLAQQFKWYGKEVNFWRTVETSCNSLNYFTDGINSNEYFIVEGYLKNLIENE